MTRFFVGFFGNSMAIKGNNFTIVEQVCLIIN